MARFPLCMYYNDHTRLHYERKGVNSSCQVSLESCWHSLIIIAPLHPFRIPASSSSDGEIMSL